MWTHTVISLVLLAVVLRECGAAPADKTQSSAELLERLRKMVTPPRHSRPAPMIPEAEKFPSSTDATIGTTTPITIMTSTMPPALPIAEPENNVDTPTTSSEETHSYVLVPVTDRNTISQVQSQVNNFQSTNDPYNQIQVVPFRPPLIGHNNNYLNYLSYNAHARQGSIVDRFTNFAGNFFPVEIDVPDLIGSLTSWIPGASLIGQILTGNRPNTRRFAVLGGNGHVYIVDVPLNPMEPPVAPYRIPYESHPMQVPFSRFGAPFRPFMNQVGPFDNFYSRNPQPIIPQDFRQRFRNGIGNPLPVDFPGLQMQNLGRDFIESRKDEVAPGLDENGFENGFENSPNVHVLSNQMYNGNLHIHPEGLLFPRGRSLSSKYSGVGSNLFQGTKEEQPSLSTAS